MKAFRVSLLISICALGLAVFLLAQQGPPTQGSETVAKPKSKGATTTEPEQPKIPSQYKKDGTLPQNGPTFHSDVLSVTVDVAVLDKNGRFIPKLGKSYFRILEDNTPQTVNGYSIGEGSMTVCMLIEFSNRYQRFYSGPWFETLQAAYGFLQTLKPEDYVAIIAYDLKPEILSDFTTDRQQSYEAMQRLRVAGFSESNLFDALVDTAQRMQDIEGRKAIVLIASGVDTFSKLTFDKARRGVQDAGVPIYAISMMQALRIITDDHVGGTGRMDFLQADNEMRTFASESGGQSFFPRFFGEFPNVFRDISTAMRNQYVLTYTPSNQTRDGKFRKIKVELIDPQTNQPLKVTDEKGKPMKYTVVAKAGYTAPRPVE